MEKALYRPVEQVDDDHVTECDDTECNGHRKGLISWRTIALVSTLFNAAFIIFYTLFVRNGVCNCKNDPTTLNGQLKAVSAYSPILDAVDLSPTSITVNGALRDNTSIYRQPPSREVDAAWERLSMEGLELITVSSSAIRRSGKDPTRSVKAPESRGIGSDAYLAQIAVFHQIHCLNELRKEMWYDHYYGNQGPPSEIHRVHKTHCLHMILQNLMCTADVGIIQHNERLEDPKTRLFPDFNLVKKCRDFEGLRKWAEEQSVPDMYSKMHKLRVPAGAIVESGDGYISASSESIEDHS